MRNHQGVGDLSASEKLVGCVCGSLVLPLARRVIPCANTGMMRPHFVGHTADFFFFRRADTCTHRAYVELVSKLYYEPEDHSTSSSALGPNEVRVTDVQAGCCLRSLLYCGHARGRRREDSLTRGVFAMRMPILRWLVTCDLQSHIRDSCRPVPLAWSSPRCPAVASCPHSCSTRISRPRCWAA
jgi:hypothetical protein